MATLFVMQGRDRGKRFELGDLPLSMGRESGNRAQLQDNEVSRRHAEVRKVDGGFVLFDLGSSNGTFVNAQQVSEHKLSTGDRLQLGRTMMVFSDDDSGSLNSLVHEVNIVTHTADDGGSRIVRSVRPDEAAGDLSAGGSAESPWLARARSNLQIMYRTALAVSHTLDIDQLLQRILEMIFEWVEADRGCVMMIDHETGELTPIASRNRRGVKVDERLAISRTILDFVMDHKEGVLTSDARDDSRWDATDGSIVTLGVREAICVPLQGRYGIVGVIYIDTYTPPGKSLERRIGNRFSEEHLKLMVAIGHQAALAVEDTSYYSAMVQAERLAAMGQTIATLSHHIKNILQGIRGGSFLIEEGLRVTDNDVVRKGWRIVEKNQERISNLVMDMLTFSKQREPDPVAADMNECVSDVVELMQTRAHEAEVELLFHPFEGLPLLMADPDLLHRAILNVVTNAIDACEKQPGGKVEVSVTYLPSEKLLRIAVADNGEGIQPDDIKKIFSVFESRKGARGTGLGLPVSQKILREHGGDVRVESTVGAGSTFYLEIPAHLPDASKTSNTLFSPPEMPQ
ncbi:GAF sensor signal transduction histidine kinase [Pirellula staleyi DSM 6068]|uniref:histidine kinase n=1 Tax=Pirellula staleyi (strain ATCC 27377 / DSM 6068 / ICPB 4128) TaxID=530564 RepID=D2QWN6_PIRSD|nr:ATP-binding protein [Pirellula staleyi]ADB17839.1 GAF sensor signal transduction histidine kinase [Pirellula staleyi DSM 6068]